MGLRGVLTLAAALAGAMLMLASPAWAATFTVTKTADTGDGACDSDCSLREAIDAANTAPGPDEVTFAVNGEFPEGTSSGFGITGDLTMTGNGRANTVVDGGGSGGVFDVGANVTMNGLTVQDGSDTNGGGIANFGALTLENATVRDNTADFGGGIANFNGKTATLTNVVVSGNTATRAPGFTLGAGGGIAQFGASMTMTNVTVSDNRASNLGGGGIVNYTPLTLENVTLSGNTAATDGGGILNEELGVGLLGDLTTTNVTVAGNTADSDSDDSGDGGGIFNDAGATARLSNTILAANADGSGASATAAPDCSGSLTSQGDNLVGNNSGCSFASAPGDQIGTPASPIDPRLGPLADNGGPTPTRALLPDSPAIDAVTKTCPPPATDQRGVTRPQDGDGNGTAVCDIGAFELASATFFSVSDASAATEGNSGTSNATFTVTRGGETSGSASVNFATQNGTAQAGSDYDSRSGTLSFAAGETTKTVEVPVRGDTADEPNETFTLNLSGQSAGTTITDGQGTATITDDDEPPPPPPANRAPTARNDFFSTDEDRRLSVPPPGVLGNDSDPDGDPLTAERVSGPSHGTLTLRPNGSFTYTPARDFNGRDSFVYRACDDSSPRRCDSATVSLTVRAVADGGGPPRCTITRGSGSDIVRGTPGNDVICAGAGNDIVYGLGGNDVIRGGPGNDILRGNDGSDRLEGGSGNDDLVGGEGNDRLIGGSGADVLSGQGGRDSLEARDGVRGNDVANGGPGSDTCSRDPEDTRTSC